MQGRLSPQSNGSGQNFPYFSWKDEFKRAKILGFNAIEWLYDSHCDVRNPLLTKEGRTAINRLSEKNEINISSVCAHAFIDGSLLKSETKALESLAALIKAGEQIGIRRIILPLLETATLSSYEQWQMLFRCLYRISDILEKSNITLLFETDTNAEKINSLLSCETSDLFGICYDLGNRALDGVNIASELYQLRSYIFEIHIKDKSSDGHNVLLGTGNVDFESIFKVVRNIDLPLVLETSVGDDWKYSALKNKEFVEKTLLRI